jgi:iron complex transport system permease protein
MNPETKNSHQRRVSHWKVYLVGLLVAFFVVFVLSLNLGYATIPFRDILLILGKNVPFLGDTISLPSNLATDATIIMQLRLPRVITGGLVGACLAIAGVIYQGIFRNPMADPYVIGAMSGASLGAALVFVLGIGVSVFGVNTLQIFAFLGSLVTVLFVYTISKKGSTVPVTMLLLTGIAVTYFQSAIVTFLQTIASQSVLHGLTLWFIGSISDLHGWNDVWSVFPFLIIGFCIAYLYSRDLNIFALGEDQARHLGVEIEKVKMVLLVCATLMTAAAVSISGLIGFVGLIIPHLTRIIVGPDHRILLPTSAMVGAAFLMASDSLARVVMGAAETPVGVITAFVGGPFFIYLLRRKSKGYSI